MLHKMGEFQPVHFSAVGHFGVAEMVMARDFGGVSFGLPVSYDAGVADGDFAWFCFCFSGNVVGSFFYATDRIIMVEMIGVLDASFLNPQMMLPGVVTSF